MFQLLPVLTASLLGLVPCSAAQGSLPDVQYDHVLRSPINPNITISYKTPSPEICRTTFKDQKQYTGYVHLPSSTLEPYRQDYSINTFFWFIEARQAPEQAPLTIYLNGGPGGSSMTSLFLENGPCELVPRDEDGYYRTVPRPWGWDRSSNILYIDQPTHVGFSYADSDHFLDQMTTQNTSQIAASATWHFLQGFLAAFPQYNPGVRPDSPKYYPAGIHLFAESYGGHYGPAFANFFGAQNEKRQYGEISSNSTLEINLESLGILNGLVDVAIQAEFWPKFAYNNSYGIQAITRTAELDALGHNQSCVEHVEACRYLHAEYDSDGEGDLGAVNDVCMLATASCKPLENVIYATDRSATDIRKRADPDSEYFSVVAEYLSNATVMQSIGARVKFTETSYTVYIAFSSTGDEMYDRMDDLDTLLELGVRVAFVYGDADMVCNWLGGEAVSLDLAGRKHDYRENFPSAGYADIQNGDYIGGHVRQYGNLSFSRIFYAGHSTPADQPEWAFTVFTRIIKGTDIGSGEPVDLSSFATEGPTTSNHFSGILSQLGPEEVSVMLDEMLLPSSASSFQNPFRLLRKFALPTIGKQQPARLSRRQIPSDWIPSVRIPSDLVDWNRETSHDRSEDEGHNWKRDTIGVAAGLGAGLLASLLLAAYLLSRLRRKPRKEVEAVPVQRSVMNDFQPTAAGHPSRDIPVPAPLPPVAERHATHRPTMDPIPETRPQTSPPGTTGWQRTAAPSSTPTHPPHSEPTPVYAPPPGPRPDSTSANPQGPKPERLSDERPHVSEPVAQPRRAPTAPPAASQTRLL